MKKVRFSEKFRRPPRFLNFEKYLRDLDHPIESHPQSRKPRIVPLVILDYGSLWARLKQLRFIGRYLFKAIGEMKKSAKSIQLNPYLDKKTIDPETLCELESYAKSLGATDIGYTVVDRRHIFQGFRILYPNAIVFTIEMDREKIRQAPTVPSFVEIFRTYYTVGKAVNKVCDFLRLRGFNAQAGPAIGGEVNYIPVARDAGLGEVGKNGLLITRSNGPRVRLAAVYTDIENLPFAEENDHQWIKDYCDTCNNCVHKCPAQALSEKPSLLDDGTPIFVDHTKCAVPFSNDNGCTLCIKYCPFSYEKYDRLQEQYENHKETDEDLTPV
jgi:epoxyqueuosine reductase